ncbi:COG4315 family predicted lipoprotein [Polaromonas sp.]|uniref:COG4315 family predicted lipoprotein n=1 Tax=Polaromonas sp. TaxID=1869339 RepID=UPI002FC843DC
MKFLSIATLTAALLGGCAYMPGSSSPAKVADGVLVGPNGMTLYTFDRDVAGSGKSVCNGPCATNWPPLMATEMDKPSGDYTVITRDDGKKQWAVKGKPLHYWIKDMKAGDKTGEGVLNLWHTAKP